jgi:hypothetical protein
MRKVFVSAAALTVGGLMLHGAFACELNREAGQASFGNCSSGCLQWIKLLGQSAAGPFHSR